MFPELVRERVYRKYTRRRRRAYGRTNTHYSAASLSFFLTLAHALDKNRLEPDTCHHFFSAASSSFVYF